MPRNKPPAPLSRHGEPLLVGDDVLVVTGEWFIDGKEVVNDGDYVGQVGTVVNAIGEDRNVRVAFGDDREGHGDIVAPHALVHLDEVDADDSAPAYEVGDKVIVKAGATYTLGSSTLTSLTASKVVGEVVTVVDIKDNGDLRVEGPDRLAYAKRFTLDVDSVKPYIGPVVDMSAWKSDKALADLRARLTANTVADIADRYAYAFPQRVVLGMPRRNGHSAFLAHWTPPAKPEPESDGMEDAADALEMALDVLEGTPLANNISAVVTAARFILGQKKEA